MSMPAPGGSLQEFLSRARHGTLSAGTSHVGAGVGFCRQADLATKVPRKKPRLWYILLLVFVLIVVSMACSLTAFWYERSSHAVIGFMGHGQETWELSVEKLMGCLHHQLSWLEDTIVGNILAEPTLIVKSNIDLLRLWYQSDSAGLRTDRLLNYTYLQLARHFADIEGISYTFPTGRYLEYERNSHHEGESWREGRYTFEYAPGDDINGSSCEVMCPPPVNVTPGYTHQWSVDDDTGKFAKLLKHYEYDATTGSSYLRAVEAHDKTVWSDAYVMSSGRAIGLRSSKALFEDDTLVAVANADITLGQLSTFLGSLKLAKTGRMFVIDRQQRMLASSMGLEQVIKFNSSGDPMLDRPACNTSPMRPVQQLFWNMTEDPLIQRCMEHLMTRHDIVARTPSKDPVIVLDTDGGNICSAFVLQSGSGKYAVEWIIVNAQPLSAYKGEIQEMMELELQEHKRGLWHACSVTMLVATIFVLLGTISMALVARTVTRPLRAIQEDMKAVADFESGVALDQILTTDKRYGQAIREVSDICDSFLHMAVGLQCFSRYMDPHLVQTLVQQKRRAVIGMAKADVTVLFSDIAGFTTMAENLDPEVLMKMLGKYLEDMSDIVMDYGGVVGEFVGDEIMAWWNAPPLEYNGLHTVAALTAALEQQRRLAQLREEWSAQGLPRVTARMGLARGQVLAGNIGSPQRMKYGLVGDNVNLASRLEGLCKRYGVSCLVDDAVRSAEGVAEAFVLRPVDLVAVKGRTGATELFELVAARRQLGCAGVPAAGVAAAPEIEQFSSDFAALQAQYRRGEFGGALAALQAFERRWPGDRPAEILRERCVALVAAPPGDGWSPLVHLTEK